MKPTVKKKQIEDELRKYYETKGLINSYSNQIKFNQNLIDDLNQRYEILEEKLRSNNYSLSTDLGALNYDDKIQSNATGLSPQESQMYKMCENIKKRQYNIIKQIEEKQDEISDIKMTVAKIDLALSLLTKEELEFIEMKYKHKIKWEEICKHYGITAGTITNRTNKIIKKLSKYI